MFDPNNAVVPFKKPAIPKGKTVGCFGGGPNDAIPAKKKPKLEIGYEQQGFNPIGQVVPAKQKPKLEIGYEQKGVNPMGQVVPVKKTSKKKLDFEQKGLTSMGQDYPAKSLINGKLEIGYEPKILNSMGQFVPIQNFMKNKLEIGYDDQQNQGISNLLGQLVRQPSNRELEFVENQGVGQLVLKKPVNRKKSEAGQVFPANNLGELAPIFKPKVAKKKATETLAGNTDPGALKVPKPAKKKATTTMTGNSSYEYSSETKSELVYKFEV
jgi:hypothetical protein